MRKLAVEPSRVQAAYVEWLVVWADAAGPVPSIFAMATGGCDRTCKIWRSMSLPGQSVVSSEGRSAARSRSSIQPEDAGNDGEEGRLAGVQLSSLERSITVTWPSQAGTSRPALPADTR